LWSSRGHYADDPAFNELTVYQRKDRSRAGTLRAGDKMPNVPLNDRDGTQVSLSDYYDSLQSSHEPNRPLFIIADSVS